MYIGIEKHRGLIYEGNFPYGRAVWPVPVVTNAKVVFASKGALAGPQSSDQIHQSYRFREDQFDPIARIRRGRFYFGGIAGVQPADWFVEPHPALNSETNSLMGGGGGPPRTSLETFGQISIWHKYLKGKREQPLILLGLDDCFTIWTILHIETASTGEELVTLKARSSFGILPDIKLDKIPDATRSKVSESLDAFADEVHRAAPASVIDRARDAASQVLLAYFGLTGKEAKDLGQIAADLDRKEKTIAAAAARIIARLHARAKPSEREKREMRMIREQDAELATQCVGTILCEIGWAEWA